MNEGLRATRLSKAYDGVTVLSEADVGISAGRVRAIVGENGAGKSTLLRILAGVTAPSTGAITINGRTVHFPGPAAATANGVVMVHQELALVPGLSVADNLMLGRPQGAPWRRRGSRAERRYAGEALARVGASLSPDTLVRDLSVAQAYLVEIAKALVLNAQFVLFDEPTAALPRGASEEILRRIRDLRDQGCGIAFVSHRLNEVLAIADEITVMRDGRIVGDFVNDPAAPLAEEALIRLMVDRPVGLYRAERPVPGDTVVLDVRGLTTRAVTDVSLAVRAGEIVGLAGLVGSGRSETALAIAGADRVADGEIELMGSLVTGRSVSAMRRSGIVLVPEDRKHQGIVSGLSVHENLHIGNLDRFVWLGLLRTRELRKASDESKTLFDIRLRSLLQPIETLSGGNQQKTILARAMEIQPKVLILDEPTRGVDVGAKDEIHRQILNLAHQGTGVILISSELEEVLALSHRIYVFAEGRITGELDNANEISPDDVMRLATPASMNEGRSAA